MVTQIVRSFAEDAGEYDRLTELDILFMALVYDIERKQIGTDHINRVPVLDVFLPGVREGVEMPVFSTHK